MTEHMTLVELLRELACELHDEDTIVSRANAELIRVASVRIEVLEMALRKIVYLIESDEPCGEIISIASAALDKDATQP